MKSKRISLVNWYNTGMMALILAVETALIILALTSGLAGNIFVDTVGYIVSPIFGCIYVLTIFEIVVLLREGIRVTRDGIITAGKDKNNVYIVFEKAELYRIHICDKKGNELPENAKVYKNAVLEFQMENGRTKHRDIQRITQKQLDRLRAELVINK